MWQGLARAQVPERSRSVRAWRRSWLLGFASAVVARVRAAEDGAALAATAAATTRTRTALVLADRRQVIRHRIEQAYPVIRQARVTYSGTGFSAGYAQGEKADIGRGRLRPGQPRGLAGRSR
jgi:hypothetical protein